MKRPQIVLALALCVVAPGFAQSKTKTKPLPPTAATPSNPFNFENWVSAERTAIIALRDKPGTPQEKLIARVKSVEDKLLKRLKEDHFVTDESIRLLTETWFDVENSKPSKSKTRYKETTRFTDAILPLIQGRPLVQGYLWGIRGAMLQNVEDNERAVVAYQESTNYLDELHLQVDVRRLELSLRRADLLVSLDRKQEAEAIYRQVMMYPWYSVQNPMESAVRLRNTYFNAGRGLIEACRGNLKALKNIFFLPAAQTELGPTLAQAIAQAENKAGGPPP
ncbi:MAG: hypothetical protein QM758_19215 [Armatimonas sp.]